MPLGLTKNLVAISSSSRLGTVTLPDFVLRALVAVAPTPGRPTTDVTFNSLMNAAISDGVPSTLPSAPSEVTIRALANGAPRYYGFAHFNNNNNSLALLPWWLGARAHTTLRTK